MFIEPLSLLFVHVKCALNKSFKQFFTASNTLFLYICMLFVELNVSKYMEGVLPCLFCSVTDIFYCGCKGPCSHRDRNKHLSGNDLRLLELSIALVSRIIGIYEW